MKPLTLEETKLKEEMKERCLAKGQYIDKNAKAKFEMLCHLEDFEVQYWELQKENEQLKDNWNKLKEFIGECLEAINIIQKTIGNAIENYTPRILTYKQIKNKMQELEQGSDDNGQ